MTCSPALLRSQTGEAPGDAGVVYLLPFNLTLSTWVGGIGMRYRLYPD